MQFTTTLVTLSALIATTLALPATSVAKRQAGLCSSSLGSPLCCDVDVLGVADLNCEQRKHSSHHLPSSPCPTTVGLDWWLWAGMITIAAANNMTAETPPTSLADFVDVCASVGKIDMCCVLPIVSSLPFLSELTRLEARLTSK